MDSKKVKPNTWMWWVGEDKPVFIWEVLNTGWIIVCVPRPNREIIPSMVNKAVRARDLERLGEWSELEF